MKSTTFESAIIESRQMLYSKALSLFHDSEKAQDIVQDTMLKALTNKDKFTEGTNLKGWLYTILKNIFINDYNRHAKHPTYLRDTFSDAFVGTENRVELNQGAANIKMEEIQKALASIDEKFSKAFMMHFEGYKYEEIAEEMQLPLGTVKTRIHKARLMLQERLRELR
jgi:RNA polymerase sigma-70 factor (ECF subfamily)